MIYQTDFKKKKTLADGSTNFPDFFIREYGCYFLSLLYVRLTHHLSEFMVREEYFKQLAGASIDYDCFVRDPASVLFWPAGAPLWKGTVRVLTPREFKKDTYSAIVGRYRLESLPVGQKSHFVVLDQELQVIYDPIKAGSAHVREGVLVDLRAFV